MLKTTISEQQVRIASLEKVKITESTCKNSENQKSE